MPRVSIVIPAYNAERLLAPTLESALGQQFKDFEIVVVNDGSVDKTMEIAESFGPPVRVIDQKNRGMSAARNRGIESGDSEFIALLDSDDIWHPAKLACQLSGFESNPKAAICYTGFDWWWGDDQPEWAMARRTAATDPDLSGWIYHALILDNWALPSSLLFKRSAWQQVGPFLCDDQQTDDWEFIVRASRQCQYLRLRESFVLYRQVASSLSKRMPSRNVSELMRDSLITRYGMSSPDGTPVDTDALARQRYRGWRNFADAHCARGDFRLGLQTFRRLLFTGPSRPYTALSLAMACRRRLFPHT